jgi:hypothetical protein
VSDEKDRIKSALEIAMEKVQRFGGLSNEEKQKIKSDELATAGNNLSQRYLNGLPIRDMETDLLKHKEEDRPIISRHILSHLLDSIDIRQISQDDRVLTAIDYLSGNSDIAHGIMDLHQEYTGALERARLDNLSSLESAKREELKRRGISGSAVEPAIENSPEWIQVQQGLISSYRDKLDELKRSI